jgi:hypothetical protein
LQLCSAHALVLSSCPSVLKHERVVPRQGL